jgi:predicted nucleic acid-binding protein
MIPAPFKVVLDANVLYPFSLRDTLLRAASEGLFQLYWSDQILEEARRSLVNSGKMTDERATRLRSVMEEAFPEAMVTGHEPLIAAMKNHEKDRHVAAAAVKAGAQVIVTSNLKHFRELPEGIEAQSPDDFLCNIFDLDPRWHGRTRPRAGCRAQEAEAFIRRATRWPLEGRSRIRGSPPSAPEVEWRPSPTSIPRRT